MQYRPVSSLAFFLTTCFKSFLKTFFESLFRVLLTSCLLYTSNEEGHIVFKYQGDDFYIAVEDEARFIMIWNPWWASISVDNPALPYLKEIVNLVNVDSLVTTVFTADEDEKNVGLHSKCLSLIHI